MTITTVPPRHNHVTRDIKPPGQCPACDQFSGEHQPRPQRTGDDPFPPPFPNRDKHTDPCPGCGHVLGIHAQEIGCVHGWTYDDNGVSVEEGCECPLALAGQHRPPHERDMP